VSAMTENRVIDAVIETSDSTSVCAYIIHFNSYSTCMNIFSNTTSETMGNKKSRKTNINMCVYM
jgi:hypothetical protein